MRLLGGTRVACCRRRLFFYEHDLSPVRRKSVARLYTCNAGHVYSIALTLCGLGQVAYKLNIRVGTYLDAYCGDFYYA